MEVPEYYLNPVYLRQITRRLPDALGSDSHVFLENGVAIKGYQDLSPEQLYTYQDYTQLTKSLIDGEYELIQNQLSFIARVLTLPVLEVVAGDHDPYSTYTISERSKRISHNRFLPPLFYERLLDELNALIAASFRLQSLYLIDLNVNNVGSHTVHVTDICASIHAFMGEIGKR